MSQRYYQVNPSLSSALVGLLVVGLFIYLLFRLAAFTINTLLSGLPVFFGLGALLVLGAYVVDRRVPAGFFAWLGLSFRQNPFKGAIYGLASVVFAPFVGTYLLGKAFLVKRVRGAMGDMQARAAEAMREQQRRTGQGVPIGREEGGYTEVVKDDGLVIRIPKEESQP